MTKKDFYLRACLAVSNALIKACLDDVAMREYLVKDSGELCQETHKIANNAATWASHVAAHLTFAAEDNFGTHFEDESPFDEDAE